MSNLRDLTFAEATPEQFRSFFEAEGWDVCVSVTYNYVIRETGSELELWIYRDGTFSIDDESDYLLPKVQFKTFGEALDAANELAATKVFGGWA